MKPGWGQDGEGCISMSHLLGNKMAKKGLRLIVSTSLCWGVMVDDFQGVSICKGNDRYVSDIVPGWLSWIISTKIEFWEMQKNSCNLLYHEATAGS